MGKYLDADCACGNPKTPDGCLTAWSIGIAVSDFLVSFLDANGGRWPVHVIDNDDMNHVYCPDNNQPAGFEPEDFVEALCNFIACMPMLYTLASEVKYRTAFLDALMDALGKQGIFVMPATTEEANELRSKLITPGSDQVH